MASKSKIQAQFPDAVYRKLIPAADHPVFNYNGFAPGRSIIKKGHVKSAGHRAFPVDVIFERDVSITMRDGVRIYTDVFRPINSDTTKVPAIIPWSPYGKTGTGKVSLKCKISCVFLGSLFLTDSAQALKITISWRPSEPALPKILRLVMKSSKYLIHLLSIMSCRFAPLLY
jgi:hypothetical protein